ncbi:uncharacterized protein [Anabrus simplex]|uniref:uncharacterized protein n=1 Tax=Anabrus simplex TaxID=316456 RepID=UPI0035A2CB8A
MFTKSFLLVLGALFILQVSAQGAGRTQNVPDTQWANVQKWMQKTIDALKNSENKITASINEVTKTENAKIDQTRNNIKSDIQKEVDKLQKQADQAKVDIKDCLKDVSDGGDSFANSLLQGATQCVTDENNKAKKIVSSEEELVKEVSATWQDAKKKWDDCHSSSNVVLCRGQVVADAGRKEADYGKQQAQLETEAATSVDNLQQNIDSCVTSKTSSVPGQLTSKISAMEQCVKKKIGNN